MGVLVEAAATEAEPGGSRWAMLIDYIRSRTRFRAKTTVFFIS